MFRRIPADAQPINPRIVHSIDEQEEAIAFFRGVLIAVPIGAVMWRLLWDCWKWLF